MLLGITLVQYFLGLILIHSVYQAFSVFANFMRNYYYRIKPDINSGHKRRIY